MAKTRQRKSAAPAIDTAFLRVGCPRAKLLDACRAVIPATDSRTSMPILRQALLQCDEAGVRLTATDLEVRASVRLADVTPTVTGSAVISPHKLAQALAAIPDTFITLAGDRGDLHLVCDSLKYTLPCSPADGFPEFDTASGGLSFRLAAADFITALDRGLLVDDRPLHLQFGRAEFRAAASNKQRLCTASVPLVESTERQWDGMFTPSAVKLLAHSFRSADAEVLVTACHNLLSAVAGPLEVTTRLAIGVAPRWGQVMTAAGCWHTIPRASLLSALRQSLITAGKDGRVFLRLSPGGFSASSCNAQRGCSNLSFAAPDVEGWLDASVCGRDLAAFLELADGEQVEIALNAEKCVLLRAGSRFVSAFFQLS